MKTTLILTNCNVKKMSFSLYTKHRSIFINLGFLWHQILIVQVQYIYPWKRHSLGKVILWFIPWISPIVAFFTPSCDWVFPCLYSTTYPYAQQTVSISRYWSRHYHSLEDKVFISKWGMGVREDFTEHIMPQLTIKK